MIVGLIYCFWVGGRFGIRFDFAVCWYTLYLWLLSLFFIGYWLLYLFWLFYIAFGLVVGLEFDLILQFAGILYTWDCWYCLLLVIGGFNCFGCFVLLLRFVTSVDYVWFVCACYFRFCVCNCSFTACIGLQVDFYCFYVFVLFYYFEVGLLVVSFDWWLFICFKVVLLWIMMRWVLQVLIAVRIDMIDIRLWFSYVFVGVIYLFLAGLWLEVGGGLAWWFLFELLCAWFGFCGVWKVPVGMVFACWLLCVNVFGFDCFGLGLGLHCFEVLFWCGYNLLLLVWFCSSVSGYVG